MARSILVDTAYLIALLDPRDNLNERAVTLARTLADQCAGMVTTDAVLLEFANYFARSPLRGHAAEWIQALRSNPGWEIVAVERSILLQAEKRYRKHLDKSWSLTDCHSMELMRLRKILDVATMDIGFEQAGFQCLLR